MSSVCAAIDLGVDALPDFGRRLLALSFSSWASQRVRVVDFGLRFGDFQIDPVGERVIVHDHFDDREDGGQVAAPEDGDDGRREDAGRDVDPVSERDFEGACEVVHIEWAAARPLSLLA